MMEVEINRYAEKAVSTAVYPGQGEQKGLMYATLGLCSETGELAEFIKKSVRDEGKGGDLVGKRLEDVKDELGDIMWYWAAVCRELGVDCGEMLERNLLKLQGRKERGTLHGHGHDR